MKTENPISFDSLPSLSGSGRLYAFGISVLFIVGGVSIEFAHAPLVHNHSFAFDGLSGFLILSGIQTACWAAGIQATWLGLGRKEAPSRREYEIPTLSKLESLSQAVLRAENSLGSPEKTSIGTASESWDTKSGVSPRIVSIDTVEDPLDEIPYHGGEAGNSLVDFLRVSAGVERKILELYKRVFPEKDMPASPVVAITRILKGRNHLEAVVTAVDELWAIRNSITLEQEVCDNPQQLRAFIDLGLRLKFVVVLL